MHNTWVGARQLLVRKGNLYSLDPITGGAGRKIIRVVYPVSFVDNHPGHQLGDVFEVDGLQQILWPVHCVPGTWGVELASDLQRDEIDYYIHKGASVRIDSYSTFFEALPGFMWVIE